MPYSIERANLDEHRSCLLDLWKRNLKIVCSGRYEWIYEKNPKGRPVVFLLKHEESSSFVGALALFPRCFFLQGKKINCYVCGDLIVDARHRTLGPAISLFKAAIQCCKDNDPCILVSIPNEKSEPLALRLGFKVLGEYLDLTKVLRSCPYLQQYMKAPAARLLSVPLDWLNTFRYDALPALRTRGYVYEISDHFDTKIDGLWYSQSDVFSFVGERNSRYLNWRIKDSPYQKDNVFLLKTGHGGRLAGYLSYTEESNRISVSDMGFDGDLETLRHLCYMFSRYQRKQGNVSIVISVAGGAALVNGLKRAGFSVRGVKNNVVVYFSNKDINLLDLKETGSWYMTSADNDV